MLLCDTAALRSEKNNNEADGMRGRRRAGKEKEEAIEESAIKGVGAEQAVKMMNRISSGSFSMIDYSASSFFGRR